MTELYILIVILCLVLLFYKNLQTKKLIIQNKISSDVINQFDKLMSILHYNMNKAYEIIYKENIFIYSLEAVKISDAQFKKTGKDFCKLVLKLCGPNIKNNLIILFGDEETLFFNMLEFFNKKYEEDEISKTTSTNLVQEDKL